MTTEKSETPARSFPARMARTWALPLVLGTIIALVWMKYVPPSDGSSAAPGNKPRTVTGDRGYGEKTVEDALHDLGVRTVVIPRKGKPGKARQAEEHRRAFRKTVKWRTGSEGRISTLKRGYGWDRARIDTLNGARTWAGHGAFAHNLVKIGALAS